LLVDLRKFSECHSSWLIVQWRRRKGALNGCCFVSRFFGYSVSCHLRGGINRRRVPVGARSNRDDRCWSSGGDGNWLAYPLLAVGSIAVFFSDNLAYWLGVRYWNRIQGALLRGSRSRHLWEWVKRQMDSRGTMLVVLARVIPGGPTPITLTAGATGFPRRRFVYAAAAGAALWAAFAFSLGLFGDTLFGQQPLIALLAAVGVALAIDWALRVAVRQRR
jgi:membrane protein DedA with SNARE-associated domain